MSKVVRLVLIILIFLLGVSAYMVYTALSEKTALESAKSTLETELAQYKEKEKKLADDTKRLEGQVKDAQSAKTAAQNQLNTLNNRLAELTNQVETVTTERNDLTKKIENLKKERDDLTAKLQEKPAVTMMAPSSTALLTELSAGEKDERYWASVLKDKAALELQMGELKSKVSSSAIEVGELKKKNSDFELEIGQLKNEKEEIGRRIKYAEDLANNLSIELAREKNDKHYVSDRLAALKEENMALRSQIKELTSAKISLERNIAKLREDKDVIAQQLSGLSQTEGIIQDRIDEVLNIKKSLDDKVKAPSSDAGSKQVELPAIVVSAPAPGGAAASAQQAGPGFNGRIVSINEENNFVIIDLGENSGVRVGDTLSVYRGSKYIAGLEIIEVRKDISAADIKQRGAKIKVGDAVK